MISSGWMRKGTSGAMLAVLAVLVSPSLSNSQPSAPPKLAIDLKVIGPDGKVKDYTDEKLKISYQKAQLRQGDHVEKLLRSKGIAADGEALSVVYVLNPALNAKSFKAGTELWIPVVKAGPQFDELLTKGNLVELTLDAKKKGEFVRKAEVTPNLAVKFASLDATHFPSAESQDDIIQLVKRGSDLLHGFRTVIRNRTATLPPGTVPALHGESQLFNDIVERTLKPDAKLTPEEAERIRLIVQDLEVRAESLKEKKGPGEAAPRYADIEVTVRTISQSNGKPVNQLYVFYAPVALKDNPDYVLTFDGVTSPASQRLGVANYFVWAGPPGSLKPQSFGKVVQVRRNEGVSAILVDLLLP